MISILAMSILKYLSERLESTKYFDESGNPHYMIDMFSLEDVLKGLEWSTATKTLNELKSQGFIYVEGQGIKITPTGFEYYNTNKETKHKPVGFVPEK